MAEAQRNWHNLMVWAAHLMVVYISVVQCSSAMSGVPDVRDYIHSSTLGTILPPTAAQGFHRRLHQRKLPKFVLGYSPKATFRPTRGKNALGFFQSAATALSKAGGGELFIEAGVYLLKGQWELFSSNTIIRGAGMQKTIIKLADRTDTAFPKAGFFRAIQVENFSLMDLTLDGNKARQNPNQATHYGRYGIYMDQFKNVVYQRVRTQNFQRYGFDPHGAKGPGEFIWSYNLTVLDCISNDNNWDGFAFDQTINVYARNNTALRNGRYGFDVCTASRNVLLEYNVAVSNGFGAPADVKYGPPQLGKPGCGFMFVDVNRTSCGCPDFVGQTRDVVARYNSVNRASVAGFCTYSASNITMTGNQVLNTPSCGFFMKDTTASAFTNNTCRGTPKRITLVDQPDTGVLLADNRFL